MTKYQLIIVALIVSSVITTMLGSMVITNKGLMGTIYKAFSALTLLIVLLLGYRAFFLIR
jgi:hypothetical protein